MSYDEVLEFLEVVLRFLRRLLNVVLLLDFAFFAALGAEFVLVVVLVLVLLGSVVALVLELVVVLVFLLEDFPDLRMKTK